LGSGTEHSALVNFDDFSSLRKAVLDRLDRAADVLGITVGVRRPVRAGKSRKRSLLDLESVALQQLADRHRRSLSLLS
jgi:hypothetical protein